jgi:DNA-directed RNA polymerase I, II, and III subunit RPABC1
MEENLKQYQGFSSVMTNETKLKNMKTTIIKMFVNRNFINKENEEKYIETLIEDHNDDMTYTLNLDHTENFNTQIPDKYIIIKFFHEKISSMAKGTPISDFISKYKSNYKFIVTNEITSKAEKTIIDYNTPFEIFLHKELYINIVDHNIVPKHIVLSEDEGKQVLQAYCAKKKDMPFILTNDPVAKYYNMKPNNICKIIRSSFITGETPSYRFVVRAK